MERKVDGQDMNRGGLKETERKESFSFMSLFVSLFSATYFISSKHLCHSKQANDTTCYLLDFADQKQSVQSKLESSL